MNNMNEAIPPVSSTLSYQNTDLQEIHRLNRIIKDKNETIKHMYSQAEMDEVMAINTVLEEEIERLKNIL